MHAQFLEQRTGNKLLATQQTRLFPGWLGLSMTLVSALALGMTMVHWYDSVYDWY